MEAHRLVRCGGWACAEMMVARGKPCPDRRSGILECQERGQPPQLKDGARTRPRHSLLPYRVVPQSLTRSVRAPRPVPNSRSQQTELLHTVVDFSDEQRVHYAQHQSRGGPLALTLGGMDDMPPSFVWPTEPTELRWAVHLGGWEPGTREWYWLLALLPPVEQLAIHAYGSDHRTGLVSRLLQRRCVAAMHGKPGPPIPYDEVTIGRTKGNKPFDATPRRRGTAYNLNFNVSHSDELLVLASDPALLIGVHLSPPFTSPFETLRDEYSGVMSDREWEAIEALPTQAERVMGFRKSWTAKQAYVKARGDGAGFPLATVEVVFDTPPPPPPQARSTSTRVQPQPAEPSTAAEDGGEGDEDGDDDENDGANGARRRLLAKLSGATEVVTLCACTEDSSAQPMPLWRVTLQSVGDTCTDSSTAGALSFTQASSQLPRPLLAIARGARSQHRAGASDLTTAGRRPPAAHSPTICCLPPTIRHAHHAPRAAFHRVPTTAARRLRLTTCEPRTGHVPGPVSDAVDSIGEFARSFLRPRVPPGEIRGRLASEPPPFEVLTIDQLVPERQRAEYLQLSVRLQCVSAGVAYGRASADPIDACVCAHLLGV